ncbi:hypothetical protein K5X82_12760 [Halosquirtibacter xylanolyticus]|uniref:alpha-L-rhamnosidase-related protein n=1 Tax=Halosquirtibacter xylanolyticus TaxID=3374599 RepID=UPI003749C755|nr:hypothetical protein K5X82_12760 [Prolixibacteraceae bacterium]
MLQWKKFNEIARLMAILVGFSSILTACQDDKPIYESQSFSIYKDRVEQGAYTAKVHSNTHMTSNYESPLNSISRAVEFKYSLNKQDNDLPINVNRRIVIRPENGVFVTPISTFGVNNADTTSVDDVNDLLEPKTKVVFRLDLRDVLASFEEKGYYEDRSGERVMKRDFNGVYIAGGVPPLSWDFENFGDYQQMKDPDGDGIYEISYEFNVFNPDRHVAEAWKLKSDISEYPQFSSDIPLLNALYAMALEEAKADSEKDGTWRTGQKWGGVWTRDVSYSTILGVGMIDPTRSLTSLRKKVRGGRIVQDTGSGGAWPVSSDRVVWTLAAWEVYKIMGDDAWLKEAYDIISKSVEDDWKIVYDPMTGLMRGESSFLDWRKQTYPRWMDNVDIYSSKNLGTNAAHYEVYQILQQMAALLGDNEKLLVYKQRAESLKLAINKHLWQPQSGYYGQYLYGRGADVLSPKSETLGEAFTVLFDVADHQKSESVISKMPVVAYGAPCVYPQIPSIRPYHNNGIWPFVQAFYNQAAAKVGNEKALNAGLASIYRAAALFLTNKENMVADNGDFVTALNSSEMLWSISGNLSMIYKVFFGVDINAQGILSFHPVVPESYQGKKSLTNLKLRKATVDITMEGFGRHISEMYVNGKRVDNKLDLNESKHYKVKIVLDNKGFGEGQDVNMVANKFQLEMPQNVRCESGKIYWDRVEGATGYLVYNDGKCLSTVPTDEKAPSFSFDLPKSDGLTHSYSIIAKGGDDLLNSYMSSPILYSSHPTNEQTILLRSYAKDKQVSIPNVDKNMVELSVAGVNNVVMVPIRTKRGKHYQFYVNYANGNGPWNTDNKCAIRSVYVDGVYVDPLVMPQRGVNEWGSIGHSNIISFTAKGSKTMIKICLEKENRNMNIQVNQALVKDMKVFEVE